MINPVKQKIRQQFNKAAATYDTHCTVQNEICRYAIECLRKFRDDFDHIADLACGTGESTLNLIQHLKFKQCYALDFAKQLLTLAQNKFLDQSNVQVIEADFEQQLPISNDLDLIMCNMGLQWSHNITKTLRLWHSYLNDKGFLLLSIPTANNFKELSSAYKPKFMAHQEIIQLISKQSWRLIFTEIKEIVQRFESPIDSLKSLKATGTNYNKGIHDRQGLSSIKFDKIYTDPNNCNLTYQIGIYIMRKLR